MMQHPLLLARYPVPSAATVMQHFSYFKTIVCCIIDATNALANLFLLQATVMQHLSYFKTIVCCIIDATNATCYPIPSAATMMQHISCSLAILLPLPPP